VWHSFECGGNSAPLFSAASYRGGRAGAARARFVRRMDRSQAIDPAGRDRDRSEGNLVHAEGADPPHLSRSVPLGKALDDAIIALYQNGEPLMPGNGFRCGFCYQVTKAHECQVFAAHQNFWINQK